MKIYVLVCVLLITFQCSISIQMKATKYIKERQEIIAEELKAAVGGSLVLSKGEIEANEILMKHKNAELEGMFKDTHKFYFKNYFPSHIDRVNNSKVFSIIKSMPKGAAVQLQRINTLMPDVETIIDLTYENHLYTCFYNDTVIFHFSIETPQVHCPKDHWLPIDELRGQGNDAHTFDEHLKKFFTVSFDSNESKEDHETDIIQEKFNRVSIPLQSLLSYRPVREKHFLHLLNYFYKDNVRYLEVRVDMQPVYELDGLIHNVSFVANMYSRLINKFLREHPDFMEVKFLITINRDSSFEKLRNTIEQLFKLKKEFPDLFVGFDLDGHENRGKTLIEFSRYLIELQDDLNFYFHAGETNWHGSSIDENLVDAIVLNTKRIGNGYALAKHPLLMTLTKEKDIGIEVSVISNAMHGLVDDLRNHPAATYLACGLPVLLSSDNPGLWGLDALSHDFYVTFMAVASRHADLRLLKQLILNSIQYSALDNQSKVKYFKSWTISWDEFVKNIVRKYRELDVDDKL